MGSKAPTRDWLARQVESRKLRLEGDETMAELMEALDYLNGVA